MAGGLAKHNGHGAGEVGQWKFEHYRINSQSTTASSSPSNFRAAFRSRAADKTKRTLDIKPRKLPCKAATPMRAQKRLLSDFDRQWPRPYGKFIPRTPTAEAKSHGLAMIAKTPGGTDCIVTPAGHRICISDFLADIDRVPSDTACPAVVAVSNYSEPMLHSWLEREKQIPSAVYLLSFKEGSAMEQFRQMAVQSVFNYACEYKLHEKTAHLTCMNISRLIYERFLHPKESSLTHDLFASVVMASLRNAVKNDECFEKSDLFRVDPAHVWRASKFLSQICQDKSVGVVNRVESECLQFLEEPANPPLAPEFFDRYLQVGGWPRYVTDYRDLGSYLIGLALFANTSDSPLRGCPNSKLAAAALVLSIKVINTDNNNVKYEFWPERLEKYTGLTMADLKPIICALALLLRNKPKWSVILERYYGTAWSGYDWN